MPHNDLVAVSYYPFFVPDKDRLAALDWMTEQFDEFKKPYAMVETNDAAERLPLPKAKVVIEGTPEKQEAYYRALLGAGPEARVRVRRQLRPPGLRRPVGADQGDLPGAVHRLARLRPARREGQGAPPTGSGRTTSTCRSQNGDEWIAGRLHYTLSFPSIESSSVFPITAPISILMPATALPCFVSQ